MTQQEIGRESTQEDTPSVHVDQENIELQQRVIDAMQRAIQWDPQEPGDQVLLDQHEASQK